MKRPHNREAGSGLDQIFLMLAMLAIVVWAINSFVYPFARPVSLGARHVFTPSDKTGSKGPLVAVRLGSNNTESKISGETSQIKTRARDNAKRLRQLKINRCVWEKYYNKSLRDLRRSPGHSKLNNGMKTSMLTIDKNCQ